MLGKMYRAQSFGQVAKQPPLSQIDGWIRLGESNKIVLVGGGGGGAGKLGGGIHDAVQNGINKETV